MLEENNIDESCKKIVESFKKVSNSDFRQATIEELDTCKNLIDKSISTSVRASFNKCDDLIKAEFETLDLSNKNVYEKKKGLRRSLSLNKGS